MSLTMEERKSAIRNLIYLTMMRHPSFNRAEAETQAVKYWLLTKRLVSGTLPEEVMQELAAGADPQPERAATAVAAASPNDGGNGDESADGPGPSPQEDSSREYDPFSHTPTVGLNRRGSESALPRRPSPVPSPRPRSKSSGRERKPHKNPARSRSRSGRRRPGSCASIPDVRAIKTDISKKRKCNKETKKEEKTDKESKKEKRSRKHQPQHVVASPAPQQEKACQQGETEAKHSRGETAESQPLSPRQWARPRR